MLTGEFTADNYFWLHRIHEEFKEWGEITGGSAVEMHLYATDKELSKPDALLLTLATTDIQHAFPELRGHFVYGTVRRNERTQTRFRVPTRESLHVETPWAGIHACGDWIGYPHPAMWIERCCVTGVAAANAVLHAEGREAFPIIAPRRPELLVRLIAGAIRVMRVIIGTPWMAIARLARRLRRGGEGAA
jgi:isorenieratene synthase